MHSWSSYFRIGLDSITSLHQIIPVISKVFLSLSNNCIILHQWLKPLLLALKLCLELATEAWYEISAYTWELFKDKYQTNVLK